MNKLMLNRLHSSQIQISTRIFHFVLPPPAPPEDSPSPSSQSSANRQRSPSVDITSISPPSSLASNTPPSKAVELPQAPSRVEPKLPTAHQRAGKTTPKTTTASKKRKKAEISEATEVTEPTPPKEVPKPEVMPPKPNLTYAQLIYRGIKALNGKATLQEICTWILKEYDYYRFTDTHAWMVSGTFFTAFLVLLFTFSQKSVRHNLSSNKAFKKMERCGAKKGKGFYWSLDENEIHVLEEQEARANLPPPPPDADAKGKGKAVASDGPMARKTLKSDGGSLSSPLTSTPLAMKSSVVPKQETKPSSSTVTMIVPPPNVKMNNATTSNSSTSTPGSGVYAYGSHSAGSNVSAPSTSTNALPVHTQTLPSPYVALTQPHWALQQRNMASNQSMMRPMALPMHKASQPAPFTLPIPTPMYIPPLPASSVTASSSKPTTIPHPTLPATTIPQPPSQPAASSVKPIATPAAAPAPSASISIDNVVLPIVFGPIPQGHQEYTAGCRNNSKREGYMVHFDRKIIIDPDFFSSLTQETLHDIERKGAKAALQELTAHLIRIMKERRMKERRERATRGRGRGGKAGGGPGRKSATPAEIAVPSSSSTDPQPMVVVVDDQSQDVNVVSDDPEEGPSAKRRKPNPDEASANLPGLAVTI